MPKCTRPVRTAQIPYQRVLRADVLTDVKKAELAAIYHGLNQGKLLEQINDNPEQLWRFDNRPTLTGIMK